MPTPAEIKLELDDAQTLRMISSAFMEAAAARVQKIKNEFEKNSQFYDEISKLYHLVQVARAKHPKDEREWGGMFFRKPIPAEAEKEEEKKKEKGVMVAVTSNQRFYGNLNVNIMQEFVTDAVSKKTDIVVIGVTGRDFMKTSDFSRSYEEIVFEHDNPTSEETRKFLEKVGPYDQVTLYFPKFVSLVTQKVGSIDITQASHPGDKVPDDEMNILFEPELSRILEFFKHQVRSLLFLRVMLEADLSRTAARLITMSAAEERSGELIKVKKSQLRKLQSSITNAKLLETFSAIKGVQKAAEKN